MTEQGYLPTLLYQLDSKYGTKEELKSLVQKLHDNNIRAICDVVINHRCADQQVVHNVHTGIIIVHNKFE